MRPLLTAAVAVAFLAFSPSAHAGLLPGTCQAEPAAQVFLPWLDLMNYVEAPDGGLEAGGSGWTLRAGAKVVPGNEPFKVGGAGDSQSLALPAGGSATTALSCRGLDRPTLRFFARRTSGLLPVLRVEAVHGGLAVPVGVVAGLGSAWQPTLPMLLPLNLLPDLGENGAVAFRFTALGGGFAIDDVYVDPYGKY
jgi:hypothetical protein